MKGMDILQAFYSAALEHKTSSGWLAKKDEAYQKNKWFVPENIDQALDQWLFSLEPSNAAKWEGSSIPYVNQSKKAGIIMAGNLPLVGMHDLICCLVAGCDVQVKTASDDDVLPRYWVEMAGKLMPVLSSRVVFAEQLKGVDLAIATGSNNSALHFEYYFRNIPHLLRKNRNSVAVLDGSETREELVALGHDVFDFFGLGCRNVTHLFLPEGYEFRPLFEAWEAFADLVNHNKYVNNYHYHKALLLMNLDPHMDTGFLLLKERNDIYSPIGMLNYTFYSNTFELKEKLIQEAELIQCVTSKDRSFSDINLGNAQKTMLWDYADGVNTIQWLQANL